MGQTLTVGDKWALGFLAAVVITLVMVFTGCGEDTPQEPTPPSPQQVENARLINELNNCNANLATHEAWYAAVQEDIRALRVENTRLKGQFEDAQRMFMEKLNNETDMMKDYNRMKSENEVLLWENQEYNTRLTIIMVRIDGVESAYIDNGDYTDDEKVLINQWWQKVRGEILEK